MKTVAICGYGYVGKAYARFFEDHYNVWVYDPYTVVTDNPYPKEVGLSEISQADLIVICVPTPMKEDGTCETSIVESILPHCGNVPTVIKSTVSPGTTEHLSIQYNRSFCFSPEYLGESKYFTPHWKYPNPTDARMHDFMVIGGNEPARSTVVDFFSKVMGPSARIFKMGSLEAEIVKYMENSWGGMKVTFANEFYEICQAFGADWQMVREGFLADSRTERMHTMVRPGARGFGGKCFPKDITAIVEASKKVGYDPKLLAQVIASNTEFVAKNEETT